MPKSRFKFLFRRVLEVLFFIPPIIGGVVIVKYDYDTMAIKQLHQLGMVIYGCLSVISVSECIWQYRKNKAELKWSVYRACVCLCAFTSPLMNYLLFFK